MLAPQTRFENRDIGEEMHFVPHGENRRGGCRILPLNIQGIATLTIGRQPRQSGRSSVASRGGTAAPTAR